MYPPAFKLVATAAHGLTAALCLGVWGRSVASSPPPLAGHYLPRIVRGFVGSLINLMPNPTSRMTGDVADDPDTAAGGDGRNEYALCAMLLGYFALQPVVSAFPLATVPAILGKRLSLTLTLTLTLSLSLSLTLTLPLPLTLTPHLLLPLPLPYP